MAAVTGRRALAGALLLGVLVSVALGGYARLHTPAGRTLTTLGFSDLLHMKAWLTTAAVVLALGQVLSALRIYGRLSRPRRGTARVAPAGAGPRTTTHEATASRHDAAPAPAVPAPGLPAPAVPAPPVPAPVWVHRLHRTSGTLAVLLTVPVAFQCAWSFGFGTYDARVLVHSVLGSLFYGVFVAKMLVLRIPHPPRRALPWLGGSLVLVLVGLWVTSALWFFTQGFFTQGFFTQGSFTHGFLARGGTGY